MGIASGHFTNLKFYTNEEFQSLTELNLNTDAFFTIAQVKLGTPNGKNKKTDVVASNFAWTDADGITDYSEYDGILPPNIVVASGRGLHFYWKVSGLDTTDRIEQVNKLLADTVSASDKTTYNCDRVLRVPETKNTKIKGAIKDVKILVFDTTFSYTRDEIYALLTIPDETTKLIRTGDTFKFDGDRSRRDFKILRDLLTAGITRETARLIFDGNACGDKLHDEKNPEHYWKVTCDKIEHDIAHPKEAKKKAKKDSDSDDTYKTAKIKDNVFSQEPEGIFKGERRITTFRMLPRTILEGNRFEQQDSITVDLVTAKKVKRATFPKSAFDSVNAFNRHLFDADHSMLGNDNDIKQILPFLLENAEVTRVIGTPTTGMYQLPDVTNDNKTRWFYVADNRAANADGLVDTVQWMPNRQAHIDFSMERNDEINKAVLVNHLPFLNKPEVIWPVIGWYFANPIKEWLATVNYKFPVLNITGTKGSGKTSLIQMFQRLFGYVNKVDKDTAVKDGNTTKFVMVSLLASSNAVPVSFSEFREDTVKHLSRYLLLSYDRSADARGKANQEINEYKLLAPFTVDGEDIVSDPAAQERIIVAQLNPNDVQAGSIYRTHYRELITALPVIGTEYIIWLLNQIENGCLTQLLSEVEGLFNASYGDTIRDRVRNNHIVCMLGCYLFSLYTGCNPPNADVFKLSIESIKHRVLADEFVEAVVTEIGEKHHLFPNWYDADNNIVWFAPVAWHSWWLSKRSAQKRSTFEKTAIMNQLAEQPYSTGAKLIGEKKTLMVGISLQKAHAQGLEVPIKLNVVTEGLNAHE